MTGSWRRRRSQWIERAVLVFLLTGVGVVRGEGSYLLVRGAVHLRSGFSGGGSIGQLAAQAVDQGLDALVATDFGRLELEYGLPFLRRLIRFTSREPSLAVQENLAAYLAEIRLVDRKYPDLILVGGVESIPFYYWDVDPGRMRWRVRGWSERLVCVGGDSEEAYAALPVAGSDALETWHWTSLLMLWPLLGLAYGWVARRQHPAALRWTVAGISLLCLIDNLPFEVRRWDPYHGDLGIAPFQAYIDYAAGRGGLVFWVHPEVAPEVPMRLFGRPVEYDPSDRFHEENLTGTYGYTGLSVLCGTDGQVAEPGKAWDRILLAYARGERSRPAWGVGDAACADGGPVARTCFWVRERSRKGLLEAMRKGRMYAVSGGLSLELFEVRTPQGKAVSGEELESGGEAEVRVRLSGTEEGDGPVEILLIRSGRTAARIRGALPLEFKHIDADIEPGEETYYRLVARTSTSRLVSNPIFVRGVEP